MKKSKSTANKVIDLIIFLILIVVLYFAYKYYQKNNFNDECLKSAYYKLKLN